MDIAADAVADLVAPPARGAAAGAAEMHPDASEIRFADVMNAVIAEDASAATADDAAAATEASADADPSRAAVEPRVGASPLAKSAALETQTPAAAALLLQGAQEHPSATAPPQTAVKAIRVTGKDDPPPGAAASDQPPPGLTSAPDAALLSALTSAASSSLQQAEPAASAPHVPGDQIATDPAAPMLAPSAAPAQDSAAAAPMPTPQQGPPALTRTAPDPAQKIPTSTADPKTPPAADPAASSPPSADPVDAKPPKPTAQDVRTATQAAAPAQAQQQSQLTSETADSPIARTEPLAAPATTALATLPGHESILHATPSIRASLPAAQVAHEIIRRFGGGTTSFELRLDPPELGRVDIRLEVARDHRVTAIVAADNPQALVELARHARELEQTLQSAGLQLSENGLSFDLRQGGERQSELSRQSGAAGGSGDGGSSAEDEPVALARPVGLERWRGVRVDITV